MTNVDALRAYALARATTCGWTEFEARRKSNENLLARTQSLGGSRRLRPDREAGPCVAGGRITEVDGTSVSYDEAWVLRHWAQGGDRLDAYILPQPSGNHSIGIRYGSQGSEYFSPHKLTKKLLEEYK